MTSNERWVSAKGNTTRDVDIDVFTAALKRVRHIFDISDRVVVSFSGGKDSTCVLMLALMIAKERNQLPLKVMMFDEEVLDPDTIDYCYEIESWPEIDLAWVCIPIKHTIRSKLRSYWWTWDETLRDLWVREKPPTAISDLPGWPRGAEGLTDASNTFLSQFKGEKVGLLTGIRVEEAFNRRRNIVQTGKWYHDRVGGTFYAKPIYDWKWPDIWRAIKINDWPYSQFYHKMFLAGVSPHYQRVAPWGHVAGNREAKWFPVLYPDFWDKAIRRIPELRAQAKYGGTKIFREIKNKPVGMTWQEYTFQLLSQFEDEKAREYWLRNIRATILRWSRKTSIPFPDETPIVDGHNRDHKSWKDFAMIVAKNDETGRDLK